MPNAHRNTDSRFCGASTIVVGQNSVKVNGLLWAVEGDYDDHCDEGSLIPTYGAKNVYINGKLVICAVGDSATSDREGCEILHPAGTTDPSSGSPDVFVYG